MPFAMALSDRFDGVTDRRPGRFDHA
jgi:hypothetical protein